MWEGERAVERSAFGVLFAELHPQIKEPNAPSLPSDIVKWCHICNSTYIDNKLLTWSSIFNFEAQKRILFICLFSRTCMQEDQNSNYLPPFPIGAGRNFRSRGNQTKKREKSRRELFHQLAHVMRGCQMWNKKRRAEISWKEILSPSDNGFCLTAKGGGVRGAAEGSFLISAGTFR